jgi:hypothetical protein
MLLLHYRVKPGRDTRNERCIVHLSNSLCMGLPDEGGVDAHNRSEPK